MKKLSRVCHTDVPSTDDVGAAIREAASQSCGFHQGQSLTDSLAELARRGGPESIVRDAIKRIERGEK